MSWECWANLKLISARPDTPKQGGEEASAKLLQVQQIHNDMYSIICVPYMLWKDMVLAVIVLAIIV